MKTVNIQELIIENKKINLEELGNELINLY